MSSVPRNPEHYFPSTHAVIRHRDRDITWQEAAKTIESGRVKTCHKPDCRLFVKEFEWYDKPVGVVANLESGEILTVEFRE